MAAIPVQLFDPAWIQELPGFADSSNPASCPTAVVDGNLHLLNQDDKTNSPF